jgi:hypothetical protein
MKNQTGIICITLLISIVFLSGCSASSPLHVGTALSSVSPAEMAIQLSDLPEGYQKGNSDSISCSTYFENFGTINKGYHVSFTKGSSLADSVVIDQIILVMPKDEIDQLIPKVTYQFNQKGSQGAQLSDPGLGDASAAYRLEDTVNKDIYMIVFVKYDVVEILSMTGTHADYDILKTIAKTAESRIK